MEPTLHCMQDMHHPHVEEEGDLILENVGVVLLTINISKKIAQARSVQQKITRMTF